MRISLRDLPDPEFRFGARELTSALNSTRFRRNMTSPSATGGVRIWATAWPTDHNFIGSEAEPAAERPGSRHPGRLEITTRTYLSR